MTTHDAVTLTHLVGFLTGIALYTMLVVMTSRRRARETEGVGVDALPFATAIVGLTWNVGALFLYALRDFGIADPPLLAAMAFSALGLLPALVVHSALGPDMRGRWRRTGVIAAYALSGAAAVINFGSAIFTDAVSRTGLLLLSVGFVAILGLIATTLRGRQDARRSVTIVALAAFAVSALHLSTAQSETSEFWPLALLGHHASIPLALVILYQDYRFALIDTVLRRTLSVVALVVTASILYVGVGVPLLARVATAGARRVAEPALNIGLVVVTALLYPTLDRWIGVLVDRVLLRRGDYAVLRRMLADRLTAFDAPADVLVAACSAIRDTLGARTTWREAPSLRATAEVTLDRLGSVATVAVPTNDVPSYELDVAALEGGRRLLSDDVTLLESVAAIVGRRIDSVRVTNERVARDVREQETLRFAAEAELRALRAQLQPHFLFNALTTVAHLMDEAPGRARETLFRLTGLLRSMLRTPLPELVPLREEIELIEAYLAIERARFEERLRIDIAVTPEAGRIAIPPLLLQPLVENAVKHGIAPLAHGGCVRVAAAIEPGVAGGSAFLTVRVEDNGVGIAPAELTRRRVERVGLTSVETRLERFYAGAASFTLDSMPAIGMRVTLRIPITNA